MVPAACRLLTTGAAQKPLQHCVETAMVDPVDKVTFGAARAPTTERLLPFNAKLDQREAAE